MFLGDFLIVESGSARELFADIPSMLEKIQWWFPDNTSEEAIDVCKEEVETLLMQIQTQYAKHGADYLKSPEYQKKIEEINKTIEHYIRENLYAEDEEIELAQDEMIEKVPVLRNLDANQLESLAFDWIYAKHLQKQCAQIGHRFFEETQEELSASQMMLFHGLVDRAFGDCGNRAFGLCVAEDNFELEVDAIAEKLRVAANRMDTNTIVDKETILAYLTREMDKSGNVKLYTLLRQQSSHLMQYRYKQYQLMMLNQTATNPFPFPHNIQREQLLRAMQKEVRELEQAMESDQKAINKLLQTTLKECIHLPKQVEEATRYIEEFGVTAETVFERISRVYYMNKGNVASTFFSLFSYVGGMGAAAAACSALMPALIPGAVAMGVGAISGAVLTKLVREVGAEIGNWVEDWRTFKTNKIETLYADNHPEFQLDHELFGKGFQRKEEIRVFFINNLKKLHIEMELGPRNETIEQAHQLLLYYWRQIKGVYGGKKREEEVLKLYNRALQVVYGLEIENYCNLLSDTCQLTLSLTDLSKQQETLHERLSIQQPPARLALQNTRSERATHETDLAIETIAPNALAPYRSTGMISKNMEREVASVNSQIATTLHALHKNVWKKRAIIAQLEANSYSQKVIQDGHVAEVSALWEIDPFACIDAGDILQLKHWFQANQYQPNYRDIISKRDEEGFSLLEKAIHVGSYDALNVLLECVAASGMQSENRVEQVAGVMAVAASYVGFSDTQNRTLLDYFDPTSNTGESILHFVLDIKDQGLRVTMMRRLLDAMKTCALTVGQAETLFNFLGEKALAYEDNSGFLGKGVNWVKSFVRQPEDALADPAWLEKLSALAIRYAKDPAAYEQAIQREEWVILDADEERELLLAHEFSQCQTQFYEHIRTGDWKQARPDLLLVLMQQGSRDIVLKYWDQIPSIILDGVHQGQSMLSYLVEQGDVAFLEQIYQKAVASHRAFHHLFQNSLYSSQLFQLTAISRLREIHALHPDCLQRLYDYCLAERSNIADTLQSLIVYCKMSESEITMHHPEGIVKKADNWQELLEEALLDDHRPPLTARFDSSEDEEFYDAHDLSESSQYNSQKVNLRNSKS